MGYGESMRNKKRYKNKKQLRTLNADECLDRICGLLKGKHSAEKISDILKRLSIEENVYENLEPMACAELVEEVERAFTIVGMIKVYGYNRNIVPYILRR